MHKFGGANLLCSFKQGVLWIFSPLFVFFILVIFVFQKRFVFVNHVNKNEKKKKKKKLAKIQNLKFRQSLYKFGRNSPQKYTWILGSESVMHFQRRCRLKFFFPIWSHVNENEKKILKEIKNANIWKNNNNEMLWRYGENVPLHHIWHKSAWRVLRKRDLRTTDGHPRDDSSSAMQ